MKCTKVIISLNSEELYKKVRQVLLYETDKKEVKKILTQTARSISNDDLIELKADLIKEENIDKNDLEAIFKEINKPPTEYHIINEILDKYELRYVKGKGIYKYNGKVWEYKVDETVKALIGRHLGKWKTGGRTSSILSQLKSDCYHEETFNQKSVFNFTNGTLKLETGILREHRKDDLCSIIMDYEYNEKQDYDKWHEFVMDICDHNAERYLRLQLMCGYILMNDCHLQKSFMLYGEGANGKSVFLNVIEKVFNKDNVSYVQLNGLGNDFQTVQIAESLVNIATETKSSTDGGEANFKKIVAGETIQACYKSKDYFTFKPRCKMIFALNEAFHSKEINYGLVRRLLFVSFVNQFVDDPMGPHQKKAYHKIESELIQNLSGIFNWCYKGYKLLREYDCFPEIEDDKVMKDVFYDTSSPVYTFFKQMAPLKERIIARDIYSSYLNWSKEEFVPAVSSDQFYKQFSIVSRGVYRKVDTTKNIVDENGEVKKVHLRCYDPI